jgi:hypothetical protein
MGVVVDTPIWSLIVRREASRNGDRRLSLVLRNLAATGDALLIGPVRQETLTAIADRARFEAARTALRGFDDEPLSSFDFERAAEMSNACRAAGVAASGTDMLICAVAERLEAPIFTLDRDFEHYRDILGTELYES